MYDSMHAAQKPKSKLKFVTLDKESNMSTLWRREGSLRICSKEELTEKAQDIEVTIPVKKSQEAQYKFNPALQCHMLMVNNVGVLHGLLLEMIRENHKGIWPQTPHPTWAVYSILRYNGFIEQDHIEPNAPCGDMMWFKRYAYTHQRRYDAEEQTRLSEHNVVALATQN